MKNVIGHFLAWRPIANYLIRRAVRTPDEHLTGYMNRYWLFNPADRKTRRRRWNWLPVSIRVHHILRADRGDHMHDHPWNARTFILSGWYSEYRKVQHAQDKRSYMLLIDRLPGDTATLQRGEYHHISQVSPGGVWTLFVMFGEIGDWGFDVDGTHVDHEDYLTIVRDR